MSEQIVVASDSLVTDLAKAHHEAWADSCGDPSLWDRLTPRSVAARKEGVRAVLDVLAMRGMLKNSRTVARQETRQ